ncbi:hypothetical protein [Lederbergia lenta]|uniref:hypothetical protein n=1 Tax=Lederbergia lenta TaxID=1467 RepID=UPI00203B89CC|nr:hypothetical protein [Lederbergia lenta]MCM3110036.1 hypothetical protein [Lederbergia lenta]
MSLNYILGKPTNVENAGDLHHIKVKDWDLFQEYLSIIMLSKKHLPLENEEVDTPLLDRLVLGLQDENVIRLLCNALNLAFRSTTFYITDDGFNYYFTNKEEQIVNADNYEVIRKLILHQNIIIEPKVYKDKRMQEWAEKALSARNKDAANITMEDIVSTISVYSGKHYWDIAEYTMYQLYSEFYRISKIKNYDTSSIMFANPYATDIKLEHFAECLDLYADPNKDLFKSKDKLNINKAFNT